MSTADLYADLIRRAEACERGYDSKSSATVASRCHGGAAAYRYAAELLRGAVAAAVEEERAACAALAVWTEDNYDGVGTYEALEGVERAIRARGESPRGDAASDGREGAE